MDVQKTELAFSEALSESHRTPLGQIRTQNTYPAKSAVFTAGSHFRCYGRLEVNSYGHFSKTDGKFLQT
ncbi:hypothetical protein TNCV_1016671 [Trichonephila clavipes]|uniref:Uncharacterized protein n=1 Tax=Trichonephila clavipes TaxID=2585209 RepID=A0A8X6VYB4_TRICX|nr:hypothetical protein TNCV_1016671 [Trichonephila clavipes]